MLTDLKREQGYRIQIRSINAHGRASDFSVPPLQFRTLDKNLQGSSKENNEELNYGLPSMTILWCILLIMLVLCNLILIYCCKRRQKHKKLQGNFG